MSGGGPGFESTRSPEQVAGRTPLTSVTDEQALQASQEALNEDGSIWAPNLRQALVRLGHRILDLRARLAAAERERDAVADLMDEGEEEAERP